MEKILVTGGTGFIGRPVVQELISRNYEVHVLSSSQGGGGYWQNPANVHIHRLNILDFCSVQRFLQDHAFSGVIHLAWFAASGKKAMLADENIEWTMASLNLLKAYAQQGGGRFLGAGTVSEYDYSYGYLSEDKTPLNSSFLYGQCKSSLYNIGRVYALEHAMDFKWARIFNLYGPYEKQARLVPAVILSMLKGEDVKVSDCLKFQDYLHVFDAARAVVDLFESKVAGAVNISSGTPVRLRTIVEKIAELMSFDGKILWGALPSYFGDPLVVGSNDKLVHGVGWAQQIGLDAGLQMTIDWWKENQ